MAGAGTQVLLLQVVPEPQRSVSHLTPNTTRTGKPPRVRNKLADAQTGAPRLAGTTVAEPRARIAVFGALLTRSALKQNKLN